MNRTELREQLQEYLLGSETKEDWYQSEQMIETAGSVQTERTPEQNKINQ